MAKFKSGPVAPEPVVLVMLPDEVARQIHRKLAQLDRDLEDAPRRRVSTPKRRTAELEPDAA